MTSRRRVPTVAFCLLFAAMAALSCATPSPDSRYRQAIRLLEAGEYARAERSLQSVLELARETPAAPEVLVATHTELGELYLTYPDLESGTKALEHLLEAHRLAAEYLDPTDETRLNLLEVLGRYYALEGRWEEAIAPLEEYVQGVERRLGSESAYRLAAAQTLKEAYQRTGRDEEAERLARRIEFPDRAPEASGSSLAEIPRDQLYLEPNVVDADGTPAYVHVTRSDMPLVVRIDEPAVPARDASADETVRAVISGLRAWETSIRRVLPWFQVRFDPADPEPDVHVRWSRRPRWYLPARGSLIHAVEAGELRVRGEIMLSTKPVPTQGAYVGLGELRAHVIHAFGSALGLADCRRCDSMMSMSWRRRDEFLPTALDLRTFEALVGLPNGLRVDGNLLMGLSSSEAPPDVAATLPLLQTPTLRQGVVAELPFVNTGRGGSVDVDIAPEGQRSFVVTLDTGATDTVLSADYARAMGVSVRSAKTDMYQRETVVGKPLRFWISGQRTLGSTHFDYALLGAEFLKDFVVELDFAEHRVRFLDPEVRRVGDLPDEIVIDLSLRERRPYVQLELGTGSVWALLDTGAETPVSITEEKATELGIEVDRSTVRRGHVNVFGFSLETVQTLPEIGLGPFRLIEPTLLVGLRDESQVRVSRWLQDQTILGIEILEDFRVRIDYPHEKLGLRPIDSTSGRLARSP